MCTTLIEIFVRSRRVFALVSLSLVLMVTSGLVQAQTETILYSFGSQSLDGMWPYAGLWMDGKGNFYGTTYEGGAVGTGTVFKLGFAGNETVLHSFGTQTGDGTYTQASLVRGKKGHLYGTTFHGGAFGWGTVFKIDRRGNETVLYSFGAPVGDGQSPYASLIVDKEGNLYGTTTSGGVHGMGTVFELTTAGQEIVLYSFGARSGDGNGPFGDLVMDKQGNLYGTTNGGGSHDQGTVFKLTPSGTETVLYNLGSQAGDGEGPFSGLVIDKKGNLYGTASGGAHGAGVIYRVTSAGQGTVLYSFGSQPGDGQNPYAGLVRDKDGNLYGTTVVGPNGNGVLYKLTPTGELIVLYKFGSQSGDGLFPYGRLLMDKQGNLYGTTQMGGAHFNGTIYKVTP